MAKYRTFFVILLLLCSFCLTVNAQNNNYRFQYEVVKIDSAFDKNADLTMETYLNYLIQDKDKVFSQFIGYSKEDLISFSPMSPLSNLLVDMLFEWGNNYLLSKKMEKADLSLLNFGGIRAALPQGRITIGDLYQIAPFDNTVAFVFVKGSELKKMFDNFTEKRNAPMSNVQTVYSTGRLVSYTIGGAPIIPERTYTIVTINFLALGGDGFLSNINFESVLYLGTLVRNVFIESVQKMTEQNTDVEAKMDDRVIISPSP
ncbi:MAG: 5'-nucleotidase C-terminal domain-containing protein [Bacteroidales bacterium]|jgi:2',3'-cyclic-nucleotide 2'-phosphodiesterase (5'-nucleotidase family)|nr:5'-nucleotidase C-terminal domain-containing protein [Bacteroidales bacterium]